MLMQILNALIAPQLFCCRLRPPLFFPMCTLLGNYYLSLSLLSFPILYVAVVPASACIYI